MDSRAKKLLIIFSLNFVLGNLMVFNSAQAINNITNNTIQSSVAISVVSVPSYAQGIKINSQKVNTQASSCNFSFSVGQAIQAHNQINLHQPVNCFSLVGVKQSHSLTSLEVRDLVVYQKIMVEKQGFSFSKPNYQTPFATNQTKTPVLPTLILFNFLLLVLISFLEKKQFIILTFLKQSLNFHNLRFLRC